MKHIILISTLFLAFGVNAQDLNTEITVNHEVVPEEKAATRLRQFPAITLPKINAERLNAASNFIPAALTPYINPLSAAQYADTAVCSPWKGYAALAYGPVYNLGASAGYRFIQQKNLTIDGYMQFDGMSYTSKYPGIDYDGKVHFYRNTALVGGNTTWFVGPGALNASLLYQYSGYNFPILDLPTLQTDKNKIDANVAKANVGWNMTYNKYDFHAAADYGMIYFGKNKANNNRFAFKSGIAWHASTKSTWTFDFNFSINRSELNGYKDIFELHPAYNFANRKFKLRFGLDIDLPKYVFYDYYNDAPIHYRIVPELAIDWDIMKYLKFWLNSTWDMVDNNRLSLYEEQPYLLPEFDAGSASGIWKMQIGLGLGPFKGASVKVYLTPNIAENWYIPAPETGYMTTRIPTVSISEMDGVVYKEYSSVNLIGGCLFGASFNYDYRQYLSLNVTAEFTNRQRGEHNSGYAPWRDHAKFNLIAQVTIRPIDKLDISLSYQLRTGREKMLGHSFDDKSLNLRNVNNLQLGVTYRINSQWSAFVRGENLLNQHWYLGPAVPTQGIMGMIGANYKF